MAQNVHLQDICIIGLFKGADFLRELPFVLKACCETCGYWWMHYYGEERSVC